MLLAVVAVVKFNRGGTGRVETFDLSWKSDCKLVDENTAVAVVRYRGEAFGKCQHRRVHRGGQQAHGKTLGTGTRRADVSGHFDKTLRIPVEFDEDALGDADFTCLMSDARDGFHTAGH